MQIGSLRNFSVSRSEITEWGQIIIALRPIRSYLKKENPGYLAVLRDLSFFRSNVLRTIQLNAGAALSVCVAAVSEE